MGDSVLVWGRAIGATVLSFLYRSMCRASMTHVSQIGGCLILLQLWSWERLPMTRPRGIVPLEQLVNVPYGVRDQLDRLLEGEFVWMPYPNLETLPPFCSVGLPIWTSRIPLIYGYVVEMCYPDRFCRQFGALQHVPLDVVYDRRLHNIKSTTMELGDNERHYLGVWEGRYVANVLMEFGMSDATPEYRLWYYLHGRRQIGNPAHQPRKGYVPISPELQTELSCMADCHQRLDPGRHPDGFVPSHEVVLVHDLLGDCIRALGHASILNHPQQQPVYSPGHIPRRADRRRDAPVVGVRRGGRGQRRLQVEEEEIHIPVQSPHMSQDEDATEDEYVESDTHTPACTVEPSTSYTPRRMYRTSPVRFEGDYVFTQESQFTDEFGQYLSSSTAPSDIPQTFGNVEVEDERVPDLLPRRTRRGTRCGTGSHYV
ncbi:unnamed protein product [Cuscuta campestris]|uniref:Aminotransferase-like plant mobile domain-containing protein n=1 Tax=Cuscuta campestris TaxID=132261 RepID=A0A484KQE4_9ASTE|nr:unnamed protein product [Cuscuta campestris]